MKGIILPALCLWAVLGIFSKHGAAQEPYTPVPGTSERRAVLDAVREALKAFPQRYNPGFQYLREDVRVFNDKPIRFFVDWMKIKGSWAWVEVHGENYGLRLFGLLQKDKGAWQVAALVRPDGVVCAEGPEPCLDLRHWLHVAMQRTFPQAPPDIFPQDDPECRAVLRAFAFNQKEPDFSSIFLVTYFRTGTTGPGSRPNPEAPTAWAGPNLWMLCWKRFKENGLFGNFVRAAATVPTIPIVPTTQGTIRSSNRNIPWPRRTFFPNERRADAGILLKPALFSTRIDRFLWVHESCQPRKPV